MRILYLDHFLVDYGSAFLYDGLVKTCGVENVIDFPLKDLFHGQSPWPYIANRPPHKFTEESSILDQIDKFDLLVCASTRTTNTALLRKWMGLRIKLPPVILIDQDEPSPLDMALVEEFQPVVIFKREYLLNRRYPDNCYPLPFSSPYPLTPNHYSSENWREMDVCCYMADNYPHRRIIDYVLRQGSSVGYRYDGEFHRSVSFNDYIKKLQNAKIGVAVRGVGFDTNRFLEVIASHALLFSDELALVKPYPFIHKEHCIYYEDGNLLWELGVYLHNDEERIRIADNGYDRLVTYHTTEKRAQYFLEIIDAYLTGKVGKLPDYTRL